MGSLGTEALLGVTPETAVLVLLRREVLFLGLSFLEARGNGVPWTLFFFPGVFIKNEIKRHGRDDSAHLTTREPALGPFTLPFSGGDPAQEILIAVGLCLPSNKKIPVRPFYLADAQFPLLLSGNMSCCFSNTLI